MAAPCLTTCTHSKLLAVKPAVQQPTLASLAGVLDAAGKNYPESAGLLGLRVRVLTDQSNIFQICPGEWGYIGRDYLATLGTFGLMQQAPVTGLRLAAHAAVGVAWQDLAFEPIRVKPAMTLDA
jgi:hypothetical protein